MSTENWIPSRVQFISIYRWLTLKYICIKMFWYLQTCLTMMAAMLKFMFIYNELMILDDKSFRKCVCVFEATLTRSKINLEFVYLCIRSKDFVPISTISDYIHWAALAVWFFVFFITSMKSGKFEDLLHTYFILFNILHWNTTTQYQRSKLIFNVFVYCFYCSYLHYNKITSIKSDTFNNLTNLFQL